MLKRACLTCHLGGVELQKMISEFPLQCESLHGHPFLYNKIDLVRCISGPEYFDLFLTLWVSNSLLFG